MQLGSQKLKAESEKLFVEEKSCFQMMNI